MKWAGGVVAVGITISFISSLGDSPSEETPVRASTAPTTVATSTSTTSSTAAIVAAATEAATEDPVRESNEIPTEFRSALNKADSYANRQNMSKSRLYDQLTSEYGERFSPEAAQYAVDNVEADWNANALAKARNYQDRQNMSPDRIHSQLTSEYGEKFTVAEADYALANLGTANTAETVADGVSTEFTSALNKADSYANRQNMSKSRLYDQLTSEYGERFSPEAAQYAVDNVEADWNANALAKARNYQDRQNMSPDRIHSQLTSEYGEKFTVAEADYALANL
ncbi:Ltp family lipoprotein [Corynebacterium faecale]|uniref:Ltp family lipoprotein n=1 Tax=Corynebacterium faecale TaxID=1758466 RepID=UPI0025B3BB1B|nr:Ltp family lipoprotein [Corynebacterium faecale]